MLEMALKILQNMCYSHMDREGKTKFRVWTVHSNHSSLVALPAPPSFRLSCARFCYVCRPLRLRGARAIYTILCTTLFGSPTCPLDFNSLLKLAATHEYLLQWSHTLGVKVQEHQNMKKRGRDDVASYQEEVIKYYVDDPHVPMKFRDLGSRLIDGTCTADECVKMSLDAVRTFKRQKVLVARDAPAHPDERKEDTPRPLDPAPDENIAVAVLAPVSLLSSVSEESNGPQSEDPLTAAVREARQKEEKQEEEKQEEEKQEEEDNDTYMLFKGVGYSVPVSDGSRAGRVRDHNRPMEVKDGAALTALKTC